jgi:hypothetical protein
LHVKKKKKITPAGGKKTGVALFPRACRVSYLFDRPVVGRGTETSNSGGRGRGREIPMWSRRPRPGEKKGGAGKRHSMAKGNGDERLCSIFYLFCFSIYVLAL